MRMGRQTMRRADHVEYTDYEDEKEKAAPIRQQRSVHPQQPHRWARSPTTSTSTRVASFIVLCRGYRVLTVALHRNEIDYITI
ncbi:hypothetical protein L3Y34_015546 [Caenorhabditis briggsae]|uniref:Uncharacterized protein n=1 Tax=Caenorhabditis briggsae TaxID=6238 RepID=A0AAE9DWI9_CAEBR|nr:hypothetical protein L3Y34_015546 [Caenorhabditis briggsae]